MHAAGADSPGLVSPARLDDKSSRHEDRLTEGFLARSITIRRFSHADCLISRASCPSQRDRFPSLRRSNAGSTLGIFSRTVTSRQGGIHMSTQRPITDRILELLQDSKSCEFDALVASSPEFNSSDIYQEISRLSRAGKVIITRGVGTFTIKQAVAVR